MPYLIKEIFYSLQAEGYYSGRPAVFCRFAGCNLWSGQEEDRRRAICKFCDTDFAGTDGPGGGIYKNARQLTEKIARMWPVNARGAKVFVVLTGGEPLLQLDDKLISVMRKEKFEIAVETNGTIKAPEGIDWLCVSPKTGTILKQKSGNELKLVYPQPQARPSKFAGLDFKHFYLQPLHGPNYEGNLRKTIDYIIEHPQWRLSLQVQKILKIK
ncbi:MAG TPA: 7-carboxy-7-deazaguanine synthase [Deltaproteobacteria bacterium]|nr:7-carboxy-7-deazaguanine synthase [Deltaproteobacteria bacterium]